jgi:outer membrane protein
MKKILIVLLLLVSSKGIFAQKTLTVNEAVHIALQQNVNLQKSRENLKSTETGIQTAKGAFLPQVNGQAGWNWYKSVTPAGLYGPGTPSFTIDTRTYSAGVSSNWTLFDGLASFANYEKSKATYASAQFQLLKLQQDIVFQTLSSFYDVMNAQKLLAVKEEDLKWNQKNFEIINERNKLGAVTLADVYSQQVKTGNAELELIQAKNNYQTLKSSFLYNLGLDVLEDYTLQEPAALELSPSDSGAVQNGYEQITSLVNDAIKNRSDYQSAKLTLESAQQSIKVANAGYLPNLQNTISAGTQVDMFSNLFKSSNYSVSLTLNIPLFSGWSTSSQVQMAEVDTKVRQIEIEDLTKQIKRDIQKNYLDLQAAYKAIEVSGQNVIAAEESRRIQQEKYALGSSMLLDVLIANSDYTTAQTNLINSQYQYRKLKDETQYLLGKLDTQNFAK